MIRKHDILYYLIKENVSKYPK